MKYRKKRPPWRLVHARQRVVADGVIHRLRYWGTGSSVKSTIMLCLCAQRGDPFARRLWAATIAEYLKRCATVG